MSDAVERVRNIWMTLAGSMQPDEAGVVPTNDEVRQVWERLCADLPIPDDVAIERVDASGVPALWVAAPGAAPDIAIMLLHGGGYSIGSATAELALAAELSRASGARVLALDYRLAPEHPYPAALDDVVEAYRWLLGTGHLAANIAITGGSAGGGLTACVLLALRDAGDPLPACAIPVSPLADFTFSGPSHVARRAVEGPHGGLEQTTAPYRGDVDPRTPTLSPVFGDYTGIPPMLVLVGGVADLIDDAHMLVERAQADGVDVRLEVDEEQGHVWPMFCTILPAAQEAVDLMGDFVRDHVKG